MGVISELAASETLCTMLIQQIGNEIFKQDCDFVKVKVKCQLRMSIKEIDLVFSHWSHAAGIFASSLSCETLMRDKGGHKWQGKPHVKGKHALSSTSLRAGSTSFGSGLCCNVLYLIYLSSQLCMWKCICGRKEGVGRSLPPKLFPPSAPLSDDQIRIQMGWKEITALARPLAVAFA